jgi:mRNA interferase MazF
MILAKGDIVLVPFPFTNLRETKLRPAVVLWVDSMGRDVTLCFISSQNIDSVAVDEFLINELDPEFLGTGLKVRSKIRVSRIVTVERQLLRQRLGKLGLEQIKRLNSALIKVFQL